MLGYPDPQPGGPPGPPKDPPPPPIPTGPKRLGGCWCQGLSLSTPMFCRTFCAQMSFTLLLAVISIDAENTQNMRTMARIHRTAGAGQPPPPRGGGP